MESFRINLIFIVFYAAYYTFWLSLTNQEYPPLNASQTAYRSNAFSMTPRVQTLDIRLGIRGVCCCAIETKSGYIAELIKIHALLL